MEKTMGDVNRLAVFKISLLDMALANGRSWKGILPFLPLKLNLAHTALE